MVSITLAVPEQTRKLMKLHSEVNWSGYVRRSIEEKIQELNKIDEMNKLLIREKPATDYTVKLQRASRSGRLDELKKKGLI